MEFISLGKIAVPTPGTPVALTADTTIKANVIKISQVAGVTGLAYFGKVGMNKATGVGVMRAFLPPGASGFLDSEEFSADEASNVLTLAQFAVDAAVANEGIYVVYGVK